MDGRNTQPKTRGNRVMNVFCGSAIPTKIPRTTATNKVISQIDFGIRFDIPLSPKIIYLQEWKAS
ncbi:hypothetical protein KSX_73460 [Ktedonospora formicarum]|uniref:Uncharacterized protein n=1 Tax=Ktedonospora formicarum TaxID=2778364 RepID=A0A8J3MWZ3_9CHLR|nr:hypothetical protein KSX_73460 [Ktedonospora formicarum]